MNRGEISYSNQRASLPHEVRPMSGARRLNWYVAKRVRDPLMLRLILLCLHGRELVQEYVKSDGGKPQC